MPSADYTVRLEAFEGPMDLLLFLIRRAEVEVTDIPVAQITDQYLKYLDQLMAGDAAHVDIERAGEFLVMAATLMEIKSRMLTPVASSALEAESARKSSDDETPSDPRAELVKQLLEYKRFRDASSNLEKYKREWEDMFPVARAAAGKPEVEAQAQQIDENAPVELEDVHLIDLVEVFSRIVERVDLSRVGEHHITMDETPVEIHAEDIVEQLHSRKLAEVQHEAEMEFVQVFAGRKRSEMIGLFLAVLELVKQQRVLVRQELDDRLGKKIMLRLAEPSTTPDVPIQG